MRRVRFAMIRAPRVGVGAARRARARISTLSAPSSGSTALASGCARGHSRLAAPVLHAANSSGSMGGRRAHSSLFSCGQAGAGPRGGRVWAASHRHFVRMCTSSARAPAPSAGLGNNVAVTLHESATPGPARLAARHVLETVRFVLVMMAALSALRAYENLDGEIVPRAWIKRKLAAVSDALTEAIGNAEQKAAVKARKREQRRQQHVATRDSNKGSNHGGAHAASLRDAQPVKRYMTVDGKRICYYDDGVGSPVVVINSTTSGWKAGCSTC